MDRAAISPIHDKILTQFKAVAVTGIGIAVLMGVRRAGPPAVGIGIHMTDVAHALIQGVDVGYEVIHDLRIDASRFNDGAFRIADGAEEPIRRRICSSSIGNRFGSIRCIIRCRRRFRINTDDIVV